MDLTKEQTANLVKAIKAFEKSQERLEISRRDMDEKLSALKTCSQASGGADAVLVAAYQLLGKKFIALDLAQE